MFESAKAVFQTERFSRIAFQFKFHASRGHRSMAIGLRRQRRKGLGQDDQQIICASVKMHLIWMAHRYLFICPASSAFSPSPLLGCNFKSRKRDIKLGVAKFGKTVLARHLGTYSAWAVRLRVMKKEKSQLEKVALEWFRVLFQFGLVCPASSAFSPSPLHTRMFGRQETTKEFQL